MKKKHLLVITQYFYPEQFRINDICEEWEKKGYRVTVLTGIPNYPQGKFYKGYGFFRKRSEEYKGIKIIRIPIIPRGQNSIMLILNYLSFVIAGFIWTIFTRLKADYVFIYEVSPFTQALPGIWYAKKRKISSYIYITDLWPENVEIVTGIKNKFVIGTIELMVKYVYKNCTRIFTSSKSFIKAINKRGVPFDKLEFWPQYAEDFYVPHNRETVNVPEIPQDGAFNVIFAGNIGLAQGLDILPKAAVLLKNNSKRYRFNIVGDGRYKSIFINTVYQYNVSDMFNFIEKQPAKRIPELIAVCDGALISLSRSQVFSMTIPAKTQSCLACGIPIIVSADGEIQEIVREAGAGVCSNSGDAEMLADKIIELSSNPKEVLNQMSYNAVKYYREHFDKKMLLDKIDYYFI